MVRECVALSVVALTPACSLILDFDEGAPSDASIDSPYTQAECEFKEPNDSVATAAMLDPSETGPAAICPAMGGNPEDADYYKVTTSSATVTVAIQFTNRALGDLDIKLYDTNGAMLSQSRGFGNGEMIVCPGASPSCPTLAPGDYVLHVFPAVPGSTNSYTIAITP
jgi:hypothetical protein